jgi:hypothetical protein
MPPPHPKKETNLTKRCESLSKYITVLTHISKDICTGTFGASAGVDICGGFVLGSATVLVTSIGVSPEVADSDFLFSGAALLLNGGCDLPLTPVALTGALVTSVREKLGAGLGSACGCVGG